MFSIIAFFVILTALVGAVWFAIATEVLIPKPSRLRALALALFRVRKGRTSPSAAAAVESEASSSEGVNAGETIARPSTKHLPPAGP